MNGFAIRKSDCFGGKASMAAIVFLSIFLLILLSIVVGLNSQALAAGQSFAVPSDGVTTHALPLESNSSRRAPNNIERGDEDYASPMDASPYVFLLFPSVFYNQEFLPASVAVGDMNGDGKPDIVVSGNANVYGGGGLVSVMLGNGDGTFQPGVTYSSGGFGAGSAVIADVNGDGKLDVVMVNCSKTNNLCDAHDGFVGVMLGNGDGTLQPVISSASFGNIYQTPSLAIADVNGDGKLDVVVAGVGSTSGIYFLQGNGDGTFLPAVVYSAGDGASYTTSVAISDLNDDGKPDLIATAHCASQSCSEVDWVGVLRGNGDGTFQSAVTYTYPGGADIRYVAVADVNGDGKPDLLTANFGSSSAGVLLGKGDGTFQAAKLYSALGWGASAGPFTVTARDVNGDGKPDLVMSTNGVGFLLNNGDGTFGSAQFLDPEEGVDAVAVADINGDGKPDIVAMGYYVSALLNNNGAPATTTTLTASANPAPVKKTVTYIATVTRQSGGAVNGLVNFLEGSNFIIGQGSVAGNQATFSVLYKNVGNHSITAVYAGDLNKSAGSISNTLTEYVAGTSKTTLSTSGSPSLVGQSVTLTATITSKFGVVPDGEVVTFAMGKTPLGSALTSGGAAVFPTNTLPAGTHSITATYEGDMTIASSTGSHQQIVNRYPTATALGSSSNPSTYGQAVTFTATVSSAGPTPTGEVKFVDGTTTLGTAKLSGGIAALTKNKLAIGSHSIKAEYTEDGASSPSTSAVLDQVVNP